MEKNTNTMFFVIYSSFVIVSFCLHASATDQIDQSDSNTLQNDNIERKRRDVDNLEELKAEDKRQRHFIGKRFRDFVGKRSEGFADLGFEQGIPDEIDTDKRYRHFLGKRDFEDFEDSDNGTPEKRLREFVGKRYFDDEELLPEDNFETESNYGDENGVPTYDKRIRELVGKRSYHSLDLSALEKRLREFVGKRNLPYLRIGNNIFFRKPKYVRELVGKRSAPANGEGFEEDKRLRDFVGKRMREFLGKRSQDMFAKRLREFVGK